jgi:hypothetical protein
MTPALTRQVANGEGQYGGVGSNRGRSTTRTPAPAINSAVSVAKTFEFLRSRK